MTTKDIISSFIIGVIACAPFFSVSAQSRDDLIGQLNQAKKEYYEKKHAIDDKISELGRQWHMYQLRMHDEIKEDPRRAQTIRSELWEGAKRLSQEKRALYDQLAPLRKQWYKSRLSLETQIKELERGGAKRRR